MHQRNLGGLVSLLQNLAIAREQIVFDQPAQRIAMDKSVDSPDRQATAGKQPLSA